MKIEVGKTYVDNNNTKVRCVGLITENKYWPYVCTVISPYGLMKPFLVDINGDNDASRTVTGILVTRLVKEYKEPSYLWANVYQGGLVDAGYVSRAYADMGAQIDARNHRGKRIGLIRVNTETGQADNVKLES